MDHKNEEVETKEETVIKADDQQPTESSSIVDSHIAAPKKRRRWLWFVLGGVVLLALCAVIAYLVIFRPWQSKSIDTARPKTVPASLNTAQAIVSKASKGLSGSVLSSTTMDGAGGTAQDGTPTYALPVQQVAGNDIATVPATGIGVGYAGSAAIAQSNYQQLEKFFTDNHFSLKTTDKQTSPVFTTSSVTSVAYAVYTSDKVACTIWHADTTKIVADRHVTSVGCTNTSDYVEVASNLKVLLTAYKQSNSATDSVTIGMPTDYDGLGGYSGVSVPQVDGIQLATDGTTVTPTAYYYKQGSGDWKFIATSKTTPPACTVFKTGTLKQLFKEATCL